MKKILLAYLNETDLESALSDSDHWHQLLNGFDETILIIQLLSIDKNNFDNDFPNHGFGSKIFVEECSLAPSQVLDKLSQVVRQENSYLQIISHGVPRGLALKRQDGSANGIPESFISYQDLADCLISTRSIISLNCMTVCHSNNPFLIAANFQFLATTTGNIDTKVGLVDSAQFSRSFVSQNLIGTVDEKRSRFPNNYAFYQLPPL